jgi:two-component system, NtrC family, response regulator AtoC
VGQTLAIAVGSTLVEVPVPAKDDFTIGRSSACDVIVADDSVSRRHALGRRAGDGLTIEDMGSRNGTHVVGLRLERGERCPLPVGAVAELGVAALVVLDGTPTGPRGTVPDPARFDRVVVDTSMRSLYTLLEVVPREAHVTFVGEGGAGKKVFARALHERSPRARGPVAELDCASLPESALEAELAAVLEAAYGGTLLVDEVGELPSPAQAKLASAIDAGRARVVATSRRDLVELLEAGKLRPDLHRQLCGFVAAIPPLRQRRSEIAPLARMFMARAGERAKVRSPQLSEAAVRALEAYLWPGNVRELGGTVERAVAFARGKNHLDPGDLLIPEVPADGGPATPKIPSSSSITKITARELRRIRE